MKLTWNKMKSNTLKNLYVAFTEDGKPVGMVERPDTSPTGKSQWRMYVGIGDNAKFIGHKPDRMDAMNHVHSTLSKKRS